MNIIELAKQANGGPVWNGMEWLLEELEAFAALVAAQEREACAKVVEDLFVPPDEIADFIVEKIRARGYPNQQVDAEQQHLLSLCEALARTVMLDQTSHDTAPPHPAQERNFCERCGKRTADLTVIHTCTPPRGTT